MTSQPRRDTGPAALNDDQLAGISGGPTEELFGNYHFQLEVAGEAGHSPNGFTAPLGSGKGS